MTRTLAEQAAALPSAAHLPAHSSALLSQMRGMGMLFVGRSDEAEPLFRATLETAAAIDDELLQGYALFGLGWGVAHSVDEAGTQLDAAIEAFRNADDRWGVAVSLGIRGLVALVDGQPAAATVLHLAALDAADAIDNDLLRARLIDMLGLDAVASGDLDEAWSRHAAAAPVHNRLIDYEGSAYGLLGLAGLALARDLPKVAGALLASSNHALEEIGAAAWQGVHSPDGVHFAPCEYQAQRATIDTAQRAQDDWRRANGSIMTIAKALAYGLDATRPVEQDVTSSRE